MDAHANFSYSTVAIAPSPASSGTTLTVATGDGAKFPTAPFNVTIWPSGQQPLTTNAEIVRVTSKGSGDNWTIARTQEGSSARSIGVGDQIAATITKKVITDIELGFLPVVNVENYGAVHDGTTDDSTAINNAIAALPTTGGIVYFPAGVYAIASTITVGNGTSSTLSTRNGIYLRGVAPSQLAQSGGIVSSAVSLKWTGSSGGTMLQVLGPINGWGITNFHFNGNSLARIGLEVISAQNGDSHGLTFTGINQNPSSKAAQSLVLGTVGSFGSNNTDCWHNRFTGIQIQVEDAATASGSMGLFTHAADSTSTCCYNVFESMLFVVRATASGHTSYVFYLQDCESTVFRDVHITTNSGQSGTVNILNFDYTNSKLNTHLDDNTWENIDFGPANYTTLASNGGTPSSTTANHRVVNISGSNTGTGAPPADPAVSHLKWGYTAANP